MIRTCTEFHRWLLNHNIDQSEVTLVVRAKSALTADKIERAFIKELDVIDMSARFFAEVSARRAKVAGINLVITSLDSSARGK
jgi:hypothetical protein